VKIAFHTPFKPLDHPRPSGDLTTARYLAGFLGQRGHEVLEAKGPRCRWIYWKPWLWPSLGLARARAKKIPAQAWLTFHCYYKAPDLLGPWATNRLGVPYAIFQGIYSTKRRRDPRTWPGFALNRRALLAADLVFSNRLQDMENLRRLLPEDKLCYVAPGIDPKAFRRDPLAGEALRRQWDLGPGPVILSVAMFRDDVKSQGLRYLITRLSSLAGQGRDFSLVLAGDGETRTELEALAREHLPGRTRFLGLVPRDKLAGVYSAADLFVFPGIRESLGMVYLEAQAAGLPVVAFDNGGIAEVVRQGQTGLLTPAFDDQAFMAAVEALLVDPRRRQAMGEAGTAYVAGHHDQGRNFAVVAERLEGLVQP